ncbi:MAG: hypothetical protein ACI4CY_01055 [Candidatus Gastranaerophilaceae bacterium]
MKHNKTLLLAAICASSVMLPSDAEPVTVDTSVNAGSSYTVDSVDAWTAGLDNRGGTVLLNGQKHTTDASATYNQNTSSSGANNLIIYSDGSLTLTASDSKVTQGTVSLGNPDGSSSKGSVYFHNGTSNSANVYTADQSSNVFEIGDGTTATQFTFKGGSINSSTSLRVQENSTLNIDATDSSSSVSMALGDSSTDQWSGDINLYSGTFNLTSAVLSTTASKTTVPASAFVQTGGNLTLNNVDLKLSNVAGDGSKIVLSDGSSSLNIASGSLTLNEASMINAEAVVSLDSLASSLNVGKGSVLLDSSDTWHGTINNTESEGTLFINGAMNRTSDGNVVGSLNQTNGTTTVAGSAMFDLDNVKDKVTGGNFNVGATSQTGTVNVSAGVIEDTATVNVTAGSTLLVSGSSTIDGNVTLNSGDTWSGNVSVGGGTDYGSLTIKDMKGSASVITDDTKTFNITGGNTTLDNSNVTLDTASSKLSGGTLTLSNGSTMTVANGVANESQLSMSEGNTFNVIGKSSNTTTYEDVYLYVPGGNLNIGDGTSKAQLNASGGRISSNANVDIAKNGTLSVNGATVVLDGTDTWDGNVSMGSGTLNVSSMNVVTDADRTYSQTGGMLSLSNSSVALNTPSSTVSGDSIIKITDGSSLDINNGASNSASVGMTGGELNVGGSGTYMTIEDVGETTSNISGGTLSVSDTAVVKTVDNTVISGGTLTASDSSSLNFDGNTKITGGTVIMSDSSNLISEGNATLSGGKINLNNNSTMNANEKTLLSGSTININENASMVSSGATITGGSINVSSSATNALNLKNTTMTAGTITVTGSNVSVATDSSLSGGSLILDNTETSNTVLNNSGMISYGTTVKLGTGTTTNVNNGGTLRMNSAQGEIAGDVWGGNIVVKNGGTLETTLSSSYADKTGSLTQAEAGSTTIVSSGNLSLNNENDKITAGNLKIGYNGATASLDISKGTIGAAAVVDMSQSAKSAINITGADANLTLDSGDNWDKGHLIVASGTLNLTDGFTKTTDTSSTYQQGTSSTLNMTGNSSLTITSDVNSDTGYQSFIAGGTINVSDSASLTVQNGLTNSSELNVSQGAFTLGDGVNSTTFAVSKGNLASDSIISVKEGSDLILAGENTSMSVNSGDEWSGTISVINGATLNIDEISSNGDIYATKGTINIGGTSPSTLRTGSSGYIAGTDVTVNLAEGSTIDIDGSRQIGETNYGLVLDSGDTWNGTILNNNANGNFSLVNTEDTEFTVVAGNDRKYVQTAGSLILNGKTSLELEEGSDSYIDTSVGGGNITLAGSSNLKLNSSSTISEISDVEIVAGATLDVNGADVTLNSSDVWGGSISNNVEGGTLSLDGVQKTDLGSMSSYKQTAGDLIMRNSSLDLSTSNVSRILTGSTAAGDVTLINSVLTLNASSGLVKESELNIDASSTLNIGDSDDVNINSNDVWEGTITNTSSSGVLTVSGMTVTTDSSRKYQQTDGSLVLDGAKMMISDSSSFVTGGQVSLVSGSSFIDGSGSKLESAEVITDSSSNAFGVSNGTTFTLTGSSEIKSSTRLNVASNSSLVLNGNSSLQLTLGDDDTWAGNVSVVSGKFNVTGTAGKEESATLKQTGSNAETTISGEWDLNNSSDVISAGTLNVGDGTTNGKLNISKGSLEKDASVDIKAGSTIAISGSGNVTLNGSGTGIDKWVGDVSLAGDGELTLDGFTKTTTSDSTYNQSGGSLSLDNSSSLTLSEGSNLTGGSVSLENSSSLALENGQRDISVSIKSNDGTSNSLAVGNSTGTVSSSLTLTGSSSIDQETSVTVNRNSSITLAGSSSLTLNENDNWKGTMNVAGGDLVLNGVDSSEGKLVQSAGSTTLAGDYSLSEGTEVTGGAVNIGISDYPGPGVDGSLTVKVGEITKAPNVNITDRGTLTVDGGSVTLDNDLVAGTQDTWNGTVNLVSGTLNLTNGMKNTSSSSKFSQTGGTLNMDSSSLELTGSKGTITDGTVNIANNSTLTLANGSISSGVFKTTDKKANEITITGNSTMLLQEGSDLSSYSVITIDQGSELDVAAGTVVLDSTDGSADTWNGDVSLSGNGSLTIKDLSKSTTSSSTFIQENGGSLSLAGSSNLDLSADSNSYIKTSSANVSSVSLEGSSTLTLNGVSNIDESTDLSIGVSATLDVNGADVTLNNVGSVVGDSWNGKIANNAAGGSLTLQDSQVDDTSAAAYIQSAGDLFMDNSSLDLSHKSSSRISTSATAAGDITLTNGSHLSLNGNSTIDAVSDVTIDGSSRLSLDGADVTLNNLGETGGDLWYGAVDNKVASDGDGFTLINSTKSTSRTNSYEQTAGNLVLDNSTLDLSADTASSIKTSAGESGNITLKNGSNLKLNSESTVARESVVNIDKNSTLIVNDSTVVINGYPTAETVDNWAGNIIVDTSESHLNIQGAMDRTGALTQTAGTTTISSTDSDTFYLNNESDSITGGKVNIGTADNENSANVEISAPITIDKTPNVNIYEGSLVKINNENASLTLDNDTVVGTEDIWNGSILLENGTLNMTSGISKTTTDDSTYNQTGGTLNMDKASLDLATSKSSVTGGNINLANLSSLSFNNGVQNTGMIKTVDKKFNSLNLGNNSTLSLAEGSDLSSYASITIEKGSKLDVPAGNVVLDSSEGSADTWRGDIAISGNGNLTLNDFSKTTHDESRFTQENGGSLTLAGSSKLDLSNTNSYIKTSSSNASSIMLEGSSSLTLNNVSTVDASTNLSIGVSSTLDINGATVEVNKVGQTGGDVWNGRIVNNTAGGRFALTDSVVTESSTASYVQTAGDLVLNNSTLNLSRNSSSRISTSATDAGNITLENGSLLYLNANSTIDAASTVSIDASSKLDIQGAAVTLNNIGQTGGDTWLGAVENTVAAEDGYLTLVSSNKSTIGNNSYKQTAGNLILDDSTLDLSADTNSSIITSAEQSGNITLRNNSTLVLNGVSNVARESVVNIEDNSVFRVGGANVTLNGIGQEGVSEIDTWNGKVVLDNGSLVLDNVETVLGGEGHPMYEQTGGTLNLMNSAILIANGGMINGGSLLIDDRSSMSVMAGNINLSGNFASSGTFNSMNGTFEDFTIGGDMVVRNDEGYRGLADFWLDFGATGSDKFTIGGANGVTISDLAKNGTITIGDFNIVGDLTADKYEYLVFDAGQYDENVIFSAVDKEVKSENGTTYKLTSEGNGKYTLIRVGGGGGRGGFDFNNPELYRGQVATVASYANQLLIDNILFDHVDLINQGDLALSTKGGANTSASIAPQYAPYLHTKEQGGIWYKSYGNFETLHMTNGLDVRNNGYGALIGVDMPINDLGRGWKLLPTLYTAYNGGHQTYNGVGLYQNGGQGGIMGTFMKGNFMGSILGYGGGYGNHMSVKGGSEDTGNWFAGTAAKTVYNINLPWDLVLQPTGMIAYNIFGTQNWETSIGNLNMNSGYLNGINLAPGVNLIWNKKSFSIYGTSQVVFNINSSSSGTANGQPIKDVKMKSTYVEFGLGFKKSFKERFSAYLQGTCRAGARLGTAFQGGLEYRF